MKQKVMKKQYTSQHCFICGEYNKSGVKARFYELENGEVATIFTASEEHCGYPGRLHGGIASAILDEAIGRAINISEPDAFGVTVELTCKFKKPVPVGQKLKAVTRVTKDRGRLYEGTGEILLEDGEVAVSAWGKYMKMPIERITGSDAFVEEMLFNTDKDDPEEI